MVSSNRSLVASSGLLGKQRPSWVGLSRRVVYSLDIGNTSFYAYPYCRYGVWYEFWGIPRYDWAGQPDRC